LIQVGGDLVALRQERSCSHMSDDLPAFDEIALVYENLGQSPHKFGGDVDFGSLDPAVAAGEARGQDLGLYEPPNQKQSRQLGRPRR